MKWCQAISQNECSLIADTHIYGVLLPSRCVMVDNSAFSVATDTCIPIEQINAQHIFIYTVRYTTMHFTKHAVHKRTL